jgi:hypothetical protein
LTRRTGGEEHGRPERPAFRTEKARADLKRNDEMGLAVPESEEEARPSVTPSTFGEKTEPGYEGPVDRENRDDPMPEAP